MGSFCLQLVEACHPLLLIRYRSRKQENRAPASTSRGAHGLRALPVRVGVALEASTGPFGFTDQSQGAVSAAKKVLQQDMQAG